MPWGSVRGHDRLVADLRQNLALGRLPHAFLFVGPEGVGKHLFARTLAKALLCERAEPAALEPCGTCPACLQVEAGSHPDLLLAGRPADKHELPIQVIRDLCGELALRPMRGGRRIAIVDDADDLSEEASNAFLKTLEEPPPGSVLILLGTTPEAQLDTVVSRCRVLRFDPLPELELVRILMERGAAEDAEQALRLAQLGEGSVQRSLALGDPDLEAFRRGVIDELAGPRPLDAPGLATRIEAFVKEAGKESIHHRARASVLVNEMARFFRNVLWETAGLQAPSPDAADRHAASALAQRLEPEDVFLLAERCLEADYHIRRKLYMPLIVTALTADLARTLQPGAAVGR
jgi:DNA polymerase-3 subunit delta'